jgi:hypothetical protein
VGTGVGVQVDEAAIVGGNAVCVGTTPGKGAQAAISVKHNDNQR